MLKSLMKSPHLVSIIVPIYKVEPYLRQCLESIVNQTYTNIEIILVDDGSPDNCPQICDEYATRDNRIIVIHKINGGLSDARNAGLNQCSGDYIYFLDGDDYIGNNTINTLYQYLEKNDHFFIAIGYFTALINNSPKTYNESWLFDSPRIIEPADFANRMLMRKSNHAATAKLYRKEIFQNIRFRSNKKNEDALFEADLIPIIEQNQYKCIDIPLYSYFYRIHEKSICRSTEDPFIWHVIENYDTIINMYKDRPDIVSFLRNCETDSLIEALSCMIKEKNFSIFKEKHKFIKEIPNNFVRNNRNFKRYIYFLLLKYAPRLLILREKTYIKLYNLLLSKLDTICPSLSSTKKGK